MFASQKRRAPRAWLACVFVFATTWGCQFSGAVDDGENEGDDEGQSHETSGDSGFAPGCNDVEIAGICDGDETPRCGNDQLDSCEVCFGSDDGPVTCELVTEPCDGPGVTLHSCASLGYVGGALSCSHHCTHDVRACESCLDVEPRIDCRRPMAAADVAAVAIADGEDAIATAWLSFDRMLHVVVLSPTLEVMHERRCEPLDEGTTLALASTSEGWLLAIGGAGDHPQVTLLELDREASELSDVRTINDASHPRLLRLPDATLALAYAASEFAGTASASLVVERIDAMGRRQWQSMVRTDVLPDEVALTNAGVDLLLATRSLSSIGQTWITPVDRDGNVGASTWFEDAMEMQLATSPVSVAAAWRTSSGFAVAQLDGTGHVLGHPTMVATLDPSVATQQRVLVSVADRVLFGSVRATRTEVEFVHLNDQGTIDVPNYVLAREPLEVAWLAATAHRNEAIVMWTTYSGDPARDRLVLARIRP